VSPIRQALKNWSQEILLRIQVKLYGVFRSAAGSSSLELQILDNVPTVRTAISCMVSQASFRDLKQLLVDDQTSDPRSNALIMVSGHEISTLNGLDTTLAEDDELSLLPVAHGG
jgi:molybdopterin converting factor small subunit